jgi:hypothetical protein
MEISGTHLNFSDSGATNVKSQLNMVWLPAAAALVVVLSSCSDGDANTVSDASGEADSGSVGTSFTDRAISGSDCLNRPDIYQTGSFYLHESTNWEDQDPDAINGYLDGSNIVIGDGPENSADGGGLISDIPITMVEQIRDSYEDYMNVATGGMGLPAPKVVVLYGEPPESSDNYDGLPNEGLNVCLAK